MEYNTKNDFDFQKELKVVVKEIEEMLLSKNKAYGNSALEPLRIFSKADALEQLNVRIDDKLSRIRNQSKDEDAELDLIGYLILKRLKTLKEKIKEKDIEAQTLFGTQN